MRLALLLASAAAFLLVPVAMASANGTGIAEFEGAGSGWYKNTPEGGVPPIECHWNGTEIDIGSNHGTVEPGVCETENFGPEFGFFGLTGIEEADAGSEFVKWTVVEGSVFSGCGTKTICAAGTASETATLRVKLEFVPEPEHYALSLSTSGSGSGSFQCDTGSGPGACQAEYTEGTEVEVIPVAGTGSEFAEFTGDCSGSSCNVTMNEPHSVGAVFNLQSESFSTTVEGSGEGTVECEVNGGSAEPCASSYLYNDEITVVATPEGGSSVPNGGLSGTGSASGCSAAVGPEEPASCTFTITEASSVTVEFVPASSVATVEGEVFGEVPQTTSLESACSSVFLGEFLPGVNANYVNSCSVTATSTGAATSLTAADESAVHTGHLVQGPYFLPEALETKAGAGTFEGLETPVTLLTYSEPVSADNVNVSFRQHIALHDGLHTGPYSKTITLTLEQTTP